ncbi:MAG: hypothetical protein LWX11_00730 [Firmicutes bacterium]|nr:hypothetical protein [Bacillota bacterium]
MRLPLIVPAALTLTLAAQTAPQTLTQTFNTELSGVNAMLNQLKFQEAAAKVQSLLPASAPAFEAKDGQTMGASFDNARGYLALLRLNANAVAATGQWEKSQEIHEQRLAFAKNFAEQVDKSMTTLEAPWTKAVTEGKAYIAEKGPKAASLKESIEKLQGEIKALNEKKVTFDKKQMEDLQKVRIPQAQKDEQELGEIEARMAGYQDALKRYPMFQKMVADNRKDAADMVKDADEALAKSKTSVAAQAEEIKTFNAQQLEKNKKNKKFKIEGNKNWVDAVMNDKSNLTKIDTPRNQAQFVSRLLVLDPGNKAAQSALDNLKAGREPFFVEKKVRKGKK